MKRQRQSIGIFLFLMILVIVYLLGFPFNVSAKQSVPILVYHLIEPYNGHGEAYLYVTPENFEKQMLYLKENGYTPLTFDEWNEIGKVKHPIFVTIDDGYKDNRTVMTIFKKIRSSAFQPKATLFVISGLIGRPNRLNQKDIKELVASGDFSIQSHTVTHPDLTKTKDLEQELKASKEKIESITQKPVTVLSYPYGKFDYKVIQETKKFYKFGVTTLPGEYTKNNIPDEHYLLPRVYVKNGTTMDEFAQLVQGD